jgi:replicative DNA helicase
MELADRIKERNTLEEMLTAYIIQEPDILVKTAITPDIISVSSDCRSLLKAVIQLSRISEKIDIITLGQPSGVDISRIIEITNNLNYSTDVETIITRLMEFATVDRLGAFNQNLTALLQAETKSIDVVENMKSFLLSLEGNQVTGFRTMLDNVQDLTRQIEANINDNGLTGIPTGLGFIDHFCGGLQRSDLFVLAGRTSQGKTSLALTMAFNSAVRFYAKVGVISLEMSNIQLTARLSAYATSIPAKRLLYSRLSPDELQTFHSNINRLINSNIILDDKNQTNINEIVNRVKLMKIVEGIDYVVIDYLQLIGDNTAKGKSTEQLTSEIARRFKNLAKELDMPVVLLSQLARDKDGNPKPSLSQLRNSGQIEEAADVVAFVHRPEFYSKETFDFNQTTYDAKGKALFEVAKGRNIGIGGCVLDFDKDTTYFSDVKIEREYSQPTF